MKKQRKNVENTYTDAETGKFLPNNPGRPRGARNKASLAIQCLLEGEAEALGRKAIELAISGDVAAMKLCLDRIVPRRSDEPVEFELPPMESVNDLLEAARCLLLAVSKAQLTPNEATAVMTLLESYGQVLERAQLEDRLAALEQAVMGKTQ